MIKETKTYRMKLSSYRRIRRIFRGKRGETTASYFERLSRFLEDNQEGNF
jgi:hypothetical protein